MMTWFFEELTTNGLGLVSSCLTIPLLLDTPYQTVFRLIKLYTDQYPFHIVNLENARTHFPYLATCVFAIILSINILEFGDDSVGKEKKKPVREKNYKYVENNNRTNNSRYNLRKSRSASNP
jgi:hypothetical protein